MTGEELKYWRYQRKLSQQKLADLLLVTVLTIKRWEAGRTQAPWFLRLALERLDEQLARTIGEGLA